MNFRKAVHDNKGFSLIEVLVALAILTVIIMSFTTLITSSYRNILSAGSKSQATYNVQSEMEQRIADELATSVGDLDITFPAAVDIIVPGGLLELSDTQGNRTSESTAFLPVLVVVIEPEPTSHLIGIAQTINVNVKTRNVQNNTSITAKIYKYTDPDTTIVSGTSTINNNQASIPLNVSDTYNPGHLENDFIHVISVEVAGVDRVFEVFYRIFVPAFIAGGANGKIYVASGIADPWIEVDTLGSAQLLDIHSLADRFYAVGSGGTILTSFFGSLWTTVSNGTSLSLNAMGSNGNDRLVIVGDAGFILFSSNGGNNWSIPSDEISSNNLYGIANNGSNFVAVGNNSIIYSDNDGQSWTSSTDIGSPILNDVMFTGTEFIAVGNSGEVYTSVNNGQTWTVNTVSGSTLNGIAGATATMVTVGSGGNIFYSTNQGSSWSSAISPTTNTLYDVTYGFGKFVAVGANGTVLISEDGIQWTVPETPETMTDLFSVVDR